MTIKTVLMITCDNSACTAEWVVPDASDQDGTTVLSADGNFRIDVMHPGDTGDGRHLCDDCLSELLDAMARGLKKQK